MTTNYLYDALLADCLEDQRPFLRLANNEVWRYVDILSLSGQMANVLCDNGFVAGDRMAVQVEKSPHVLALYFACIRAGGVFLPLNTAYTVAELDYFIADATPTMVVCDAGNQQALATLVASHKATLLTLNGDGTGELTSAAKAAPKQFTSVARGADDLAAILYTSGTTGRSKGAMLSHANLLSNAQALAHSWQFDEHDVLLHTLPIFHIHGLFVAINVTLVARCSMIFLPRFDANEIIRHLPKATTLMGVPTFYVRLLAQKNFTRALVAHIRLFVSGSAPLLAETHETFAARTGQRILERYGMTETNMNTSNPYEGERRAGAVGFALPGVEVKICQPGSEATVPQGEIGMIEVRGPNVFKGYWQNPSKTAEELRASGFFITGDLGMVDDDGYIHIVGRTKDLVISGGFNVYPKEVETQIDLLDGVVESAVIGIPHADFGEAVVAVAVQAVNTALTEMDVLTSIGGELARFKQPKRVIFVDHLPRNTMGKVQKNVLRDTYQELFNETTS